MDWSYTKVIFNGDSWLKKNFWRGKRYKLQIWMSLESEKRKKNQTQNLFFSPTGSLQPQCEYWIIITCFSNSEILEMKHNKHFFFLIHTSRPLCIATGQSNSAKNNCVEDTCLSLLIFTRNKKGYKSISWGDK